MKHVTTVGLLSILSMLSLTAHAEDLKKIPCPALNVIKNQAAHIDSFPWADGGDHYGFTTKFGKEFHDGGYQWSLLVHISHLDAKDKNQALIIAKKKATNVYWPVSFYARDLGGEAYACDYLSYVSGTTASDPVMAFTVPQTSPYSEDLVGQEGVKRMALIQAAWGKAQQ